jgi:D-arabinono-1,4-lactone oxidase
MRPHWGKLFHMNAATIATLYERHGDFVRLQERLDPRGAFRNQWLQSHVLGNAELHRSVIPGVEGAERTGPWRVHVSNAVPGS